MIATTCNVYLESHGTINHTNNCLLLSKKATPICKQKMFVNEEKHVENLINDSLQACLLRPAHLGRIKKGSQWLRSRACENSDELTIQLSQFSVNLVQVSCGMSDYHIDHYMVNDETTKLNCALKTLTNLLSCWGFRGTWVITRWRYH